MIPYIPQLLVMPPRIPSVPTAWYGCESVLADIIDRLDIDTKTACEFGVFYGYSTAVLANYFDFVVGIDTFNGDEQAGKCSLTETRNALKEFTNIHLVEANYKEFTATAKHGSFDLIHVDILHTFEDTYTCGKWATEHSNVVLFHDTLSYPEVMRAVTALADETGMYFYNWNEGYGLGILARKKIDE